MKPGWKKIFQRGAPAFFAYVSATLLNALVANAGGAFTPNLKTKLTNRADRFRIASGFQSVNLPELIATVIQALLSVLAILFVCLILYGGYVWMMARGNENEVDRGRAIVRHSIIGLIVVVSSYALGYFLLYWIVGSGTDEGRPLVP